MKDIQITQVMGLSFDEPRRVANVKRRFFAMPKNWNPEFPLFEDFATRLDCQNYLEKRLPDVKVPRSACVFCPYKSDAEWSELKTNDPAGWLRAVEIDHAIRDKTSACNRGLDSTQYLHRSCQPLELIQFDPSPPDPQKRMSFSSMDCEGMCGV